MSTPAARGYRQLLHHCAVAEMMIPGLPVPGGLLQSVRMRYREIVSKNLDLPLRQRRALGEKQRESLDRLCAALTTCHENETMVAIAKALSSGYGNEAYRSTLFRHFTETPEFDAVCAERRVHGADEVAERQNRLMQAAVFPYLERLCILSSPTLQHSCSAETSSPSKFSDNELLRALSSPKAGVTVQVFPCDPHFLAVEIDEALNKQTIYISVPPSSSAELTEAAEIAAEEKRMEKAGKSNAATPRAGGAGGSIYHHRVDTAQLETQRGTILHLEWMNSARRILDTLLDESLVHRSRGTVIVGHGVAGAVGTALGLLMISEQFLLRNVITFGAPKVVEEIEQHTEMQLNSLRIVLAGDPLVPLPVSGEEGRLFRHVGELLQVHSAAAERAFAPAPSEAKKDSKSGKSAASSAPASGTAKQKNAVEETDGVDDSEAAERLFAALNNNNDDRPATSATPSSARRPETQAEATPEGKDREKVRQQLRYGEPVADDEDEDPAIDFSEKEAVASEEQALQRPFSVVAYRAALADAEAALEYFENDAAVWERDDIRERFHGHDAFQKSADENEETAFR